MDTQKRHAQDAKGSGARSMKITPCLDCEYRHPKCHSKCAVYMDWVKDYKAEKVAAMKTREGERLYMDYQASLSDAIYKRNRCCKKQIGQA